MYESVDFNDFMMGMVVTLSIQAATKWGVIDVGWGGLYHKEERRDVVYLTHTVRIEEGNVDTTGFIAITRTFFTSGRPGQGVLVYILTDSIGLAWIIV